MSLFLIEGVEDKNVESPILDLARSVDRVSNQLNLNTMAHIADLLWITGELRATLSSWGETEISNAVTKDRVQHLVSALARRVEDIR